MGASNQAPVKVSVVVMDEGTPTSVLLQYRPAGSTVWTSTDLYDDGLHGDGAAGDRTYGNQFSVSTSVTEVEYRFVAQDAQGLLGTWPCTYTTHALHPFPAIVINEAQSANQNTVYDQYGDDSDWLELYNLGASSAPLVGLTLTDDPSNPGAFRFKSGSIGGNAHAMLWASGDTSQYLDHASFKLSSGGEFLGLYFLDNQGTYHLLDEVQIPALASDHSYGRLTDGHAQWVVFAEHPTPLMPNAGSLKTEDKTAMAWMAAPNPFRAGTWIQSPENTPAQVEITNALGQVVQQFQGEGPFYWAGDTPGIYWLRITTASGVQVLPVVQE